MSKLNGGLMELEESVYWLELIEGADLMSHERLAALAQEADELTAIFVSLIRKEKGGR